MKNCLFCRNKIISETEEHIIPESLGNNNLIVSGVVCNKCNNGILSDLDNYFCHNNLFAETKMFYVDKTKKGKFPKILTLNGTIEKIDKNKTKLTQNIKTQNNFLIKTTENCWEFCFNIIKRGINPHKISQFLTKVGIESLFHFQDEIAYNNIFDEAREYTIGIMKNKFIPFSWKKTNKNKVGIFISELVNDKSEKYYISTLRLYNCDYFIQLNDPFNPVALNVFNNKYNLNYINDNKQIVPNLLKNSIKFNLVPINKALTII